MLLDNDILIDAGTGVADLSLTELSLIDHVFLTHSHLDHVASIPFMVDTVGGMRNKPLTVWALPATLEIIRNHVFNWSIWPDFAQIPSPERPFLQYREVQVTATIELQKRRITPLPANHVVPAVGYHLDSGRGSLVFTGDTTTNDPLWAAVNRISNLKYLIIETAFCNRERDLAITSKHLCPGMLAEELAKLERSAEIYITHLKPGEIELTMQEIEDDAGQYRPRMLQNNQVFDF
jgi:cAMP phosphodiesterase